MDNGSKNKNNKDNVIYSDSVEYLVYVTIAIVYVTLLVLLIDRILGLEKLDAECTVLNFKFNRTLEQQEEESHRLLTCEKRREEYQDKQFSYTIVAGIISLLVGGYVTTLNGSYNIAGAGVALGGLFSIIYASAINWHRITTDLKIVMLTVALVSLGYGSTLLF